jgi:hypothetical protein
MNKKIKTLANFRPGKNPYHIVSEPTQTITPLLFDPMCRKSIKLLWYRRLLYATEVEVRQAKTTCSIEMQYDDFSLWKTKRKLLNNHLDLWWPLFECRLPQRSPASCLPSLLPLSLCPPAALQRAGGFGDATFARRPRCMYLPRSGHSSTGGIWRRYTV